MTTDSRTDTADLRALFLLDPEVVFLNHGSFGACPRPVFAAYQHWQLELERQPVAFMQSRLNELLQTTRQKLGTYLNADAEELVLVTNVSMGLNIVARSLDLQPGDEVLSTDHEYGTLDRTWELVCKRRDATYIRRPIALPITSSEEIVDAVWSGVTERTRVLYCSHITSPTALIFPVGELVQKAREAGITTIIDGAHAAGQIPLDLSALGADFYSANCHKWMMSPKGAGFLHARKEMHDLLDPLVGGKAGNITSGSRLIAEHQYQGTRDSAAFIAVSNAIDFMAEHNWPQVRQQCHELARYARDQVSALTGLPAVVPDSPQFFAQMAILPIPPCDAAALKRRLLDEHSIELPITGYGEQRFLRISVQGYTARADIDALVAALATLLPELST